ncbi:hypothetical protein CAPTEDRAFT_208754 [Capitella teleta]|uniref:Uncharacterized protein n=1 Tax=Capitella teleta TaxID=283909 RepID=R7VAZ4_CAPTE|nr:hypothetical protein CAPTEDRAFT_208754 [Capitella teleta]|eukprot:ELU13506.1 hypothetical protein CAPTEDRAFT_208754 [Capitella teleta]
MIADWTLSDPISDEPRRRRTPQNIINVPGNKISVCALSQITQVITMEEFLRDHRNRQRRFILQVRMQQLEKFFQDTTDCRRALNHNSKAAAIMNSKLKSIEAEMEQLRHQMRKLGPPANRPHLSR